MENKKEQTAKEQEPGTQKISRRKAIKRIAEVLAGAAVSTFVASRNQEVISYFDYALYSEVYIDYSRYKEVYGDYSSYHSIYVPPP